MIEDLEAALITAFSSVVIDRAMIDEPSAMWEPYTRYDELGAFEGKTWRDLTRDELYRHPTLPAFAGDAFWRALLPAFLWYVLHEQVEFNALPFQLASQLTLKEDPASRAHLYRRIAPLSLQQKTTIREVLTFLSSVAPIDEVMSSAAETWNELTREGSHEG